MIMIEQFLCRVRQLKTALKFKVLSFGEDLGEAKPTKKFT